MYGMTSAHGVQRLAELLQTLRQEELAGPDGDSFRVTFSAGVAQYPEDGADLAALYRSADQALYQAKTSGRDRVLPAGLGISPPQVPRYIATEPGVGYRLLVE
jgi:diguanylate cyclase (GGDEF)-like protein